MRSKERKRRRLQSFYHQISRKPNKTPSDIALAHEINQELARYKRAALPRTNAKSDEKDSFDYEEL